MNDIEKTNLYNDGQYLENNPTWHTEDSPWKALQILKLLDKNNIKPKTISEIGCGAGEILNNLYNEMEEDITFCGYEVSEDAYQICKNKEKARLNFQLKDFLTESDKHYDALLLIDIVEHIDDYIGFLKQVKNKGKYKVFNVPLEIFALKALFGHYYLESREKYGHIHYFNKDIFLAVLEDAGYKVLDWHYGNSVLELAGISKSISLKSRMLHIPRRILNKINVDFSAKLLGGYSLFVLVE
ncbi:MAG: class I SAM-dependent methyltransferase [bacterium]